MSSGRSSDNRIVAGPIKVTLLLCGLSVALAAHVLAATAEDWRVMLPARLRAAIEQLDWQRYYVVPQPRQEKGAALSPAGVRGLDSLQRRHPGARRVAVDARLPVPLLVEGKGIPWLPGRGNQLGAPAFGVRPHGELAVATVADVAALAIAFTRENQALLGIDPDHLELDRGTVAHFGEQNRFWSLRLHQVLRDATLGTVPVRDAYLFFRVSHGNLTQFGNHLAIPLQGLPQGLDTAGILSRAQALQRALALVDNPASVTVSDAAIDLGQADRSLQLVLVNGAGGTLGHQLVRSFVLDAPRYNLELWLDAHSGELVHAINRRLNAEASVRGGIYPTTNTEPEVLRGLPFLTVTNGGVPKTTGVTGTYDYAPAGSLATATLDGDFVTVYDDCGASSLATSFAPGDLSFGASAGTDCATPGYGGDGNTHAARSTYYHVNLIKEKARQYLNDAPDTLTTWLDEDLTTQVNRFPSCNAGWNGSSISFQKYTDDTGYDCANTGEIPGIFLHEFGHGLDDNTNGIPDLGSGEAYADVMAFLQTHAACIGHNVKPGVPCQYGCDASCTGFRNVDVAPNVRPSNINAAPANCEAPYQFSDGSSTIFSCPNDGYMGPMGYQGHCESLIASGAVWDMAQAFVGRYGEGAGWALADRIWYESLHDTVSAYQVVSGGLCNPAAMVDGCGADNWYTVFLALDDDNGDLADGTPNADLIWGAFNDHGIACGAAEPPVSPPCPAPPTPLLTAAAGTGEVDLSWTAAAGATSYTVFRNELGCGFGFTPIAEVAAPGTAYTDAAAANGTTYYYAVQSVGTSELCVSAFSPCQTATPSAPLVPADIFMVLDQSGSMAGSTDVAGERKIDALRDAALMVADVVDDYAADGFELGAVSFSTTVTGEEGLAADMTALTTFVNGLEPTNLTAIGLGINEALASFPMGSSDRKVVMLLSDGIQNVPPMLELAMPAPGAAVGGTALPADVRFYTVALGTSIQEDLFDDLTTTGGIPGFYYSGGTAEIQGNFAFWAADVLGLDPDPPFPPATAAAAAAAPAETNFPVNQTARRVTFLLTWAAKGTDLRFHLDTPAGPLTPPADSFHPAQGYAAWTVRLPLPHHGPQDHVGPWLLRVTGPQGEPAGVPSTAYALFDDPALRPKYMAGGNDPGAGEPLPLEAQIYENGVPLSGLTVRASLVGPDEGLGEALSAASARPLPATGDPGDPAAQKLAALLAADPELIGELSNLVTLTEASPGVYRAELPAARTTAAGTYVVDFVIEGTGKVNGPFRRSQRFSRYLRLKPTTANTLVAAERFGEDDDGDLRGSRPVHLRITPRDRNNQRLGPGWAGSFRVTASAGTVAGPVRDNLDGSYTAVLVAPAGSDPAVEVTVRGETVAAGPLSRWAGSRRLAAGPFLGYTFFDAGLPLAGGFVVGGRWAIGLTGPLAFETEIGVTFTDHRQEEGVALQALQNLVYDLRGSGRVRPFVLAGIGALLCEGFGADDASLLWSFGGGLKAAIGGGLDLRVDLRDLVADDLYGAGTTHNPQVTLGLTATLP